VVQDPGTSTAVCLSNFIISLDLINHASPRMDRTKSDLFKDGIKNRREVVGDEYVNRALEKNSSQFTYPCQEFVTE
jgi:hypothetical protein